MIKNRTNLQHQTEHVLKVHKFAVEEVPLQKATYDSTTLPLFSNRAAETCYEDFFWEQDEPGDFHAVEINHAELSFLILV